MKDAAVLLDETKIRRDLAAAFRICARNSWNENLGNHLSAKIPGPEPRFLVNPRHLHFRQASASNLIVCDLDGKTIKGEGEIRPVAFWIHARIHQRHDHAKVILHLHTPYATALSCLEGFRFTMAYNNNTVINERIVYDDELNGPVDGIEEGDRLASLLGKKTILMMASHGVLVVGPTVADALYELCLLERTAMYTLYALQTGRKLREIPAERKKSPHYPISSFVESDSHLNAWHSMLAREEPEYLV